MRNIQRADKVKCQRMVQDGGRKAKNICVQLATWEATLFQSAEEYFQAKPETRGLDGTNPVLMLHNRRTN